MAQTKQIDEPEEAQAKSGDAGKNASLYRMAMPGHLCPCGLKSKSILECKGYKVDDDLLTTREEVDEFKKLRVVKTTPITNNGREQIGDIPI